MIRAPGWLDSASGERGVWILSMPAGQEKDLQ
jgi:hypothetical protein